MKSTSREMSIPRSFDSSEEGNLGLSDALVLSEQA